MDKLIEIIVKSSGAGKRVLNMSFDSNDVWVPDLSEKNTELERINLDDPEEFGTWLNCKIIRNDKKLAAGGYGEDRVVYKRSKHFGQGSDARSIHLGIDLWAKAGREVVAPFDATIHSFRNNDNHGDYGGTIILQHEIEGKQFYTLYGHLSLESLQHKEEGMPVNEGDIFAWLGRPSENGGWPPHLHFQLIRDMGDKKGDYYGVASQKEKDERLHMCPDPNYILQLDALK
ncbi:Membrane-bound metallopeptidase [Salinivirga cyanobacteriivorans]|uniref:Membrane-bound metallopeptidase n=1 Tax=Salinivirga cyanobacteriivorans TaxID=1307839 RepID=A0A0S2HV60_9BACT|nr:peptidoglycan DD-metalloendopeptidase family protein [Salinivirga cyanobacteriivorans]ALO13951.1 Membrane-bound metallopeptidase [Salinivirga cyanobacteriivorans]